MINKATEIFFAVGSNFKVKLLAYFLIIIPRKVGAATIKNIWIAILSNEIFSVILFKPSKSTEVNTTNGTVKTLNKLITAVKEIDKATSPLASEVKIFEVTPPGAEAIIITPIASSGDIGQIFIIINATIGKSIIWLNSPIKKSLGWL